MSTMFLDSAYNALGNSLLLLEAAEPVALVKQPGKIVGPIAVILGNVCNWLFNMVSTMFESGTLGITIIFFTIVVRIILLPFAAYSAKSMAKMRIVQPEITKIQEKYKGKTDQEAVQKMNMEISELQRKKGVNPLSGCLPLVIQMPIIYALFFILQRVYLYINTIGELYTKIANTLMSYEHIGPVFSPVIRQMPALKKFAEGTASFQLSYADNFREVISKMSQADWAQLFQPVTLSTGEIAQIPAEIVSQLQPLLQEKEKIEYFLGMNLVERPTLWPLSIAILIPLLSGFTTFLTTWLSNKAQAAPTTEQAKTQQKMMMIVMPIMMGFMAFSLPAGLGLYWTIGNIFQMGQQYVFNKIFNKDADD